MILSGFSSSLCVVRVTERGWSVLVIALLVRIVAIFLCVGVVVLHIAVLVIVVILLLLVLVILLLLKVLLLVVLRLLLLIVAHLLLLLVDGIVVGNNLLLLFGVDTTLALEELLVEAGLGGRGLRHRLLQILLIVLVHGDVRLWLSLHL